MSHLTSSIDHRVATLTLTNPPQNRITAEMTDDLAHALEAAVSGPQPRKLPRTRPAASMTTSLGVASTP